MGNNNENWVDISGYEGYYSISDCGRVLSKRYNKIMTPILGCNGYLRTSLSVKGVFKIIEIHRIVALSFLNDGNNKKQVNHKDGNKLNNRIDNLEWVTSSENMRHAYKNNLIKKVYYPSFFGGKIGCNNVRKRKIAQIDKESNEVIKIFESISQAMRELNVSFNIISVCNGKRKSSAGYKWQYV